MGGWELGAGIRWGVEGRVRGKQKGVGLECCLEKAMALLSSVLAWRIPWTEEPAGYSPWGHKESDTTERLHHRMLSIVSYQT